MKAFRVFLVASLAAGAFSTPAPAEERTPPPPDQMILDLRAEGWVVAKTAKVRAVIETALGTGRLESARGRMKEILGRLLSGAEWRITRFQRSRDSAGLERWKVYAESRAPESRLTGLYDRAKAASRPGQQVRIAGVDFLPTLAEREAVLSKLRAEIYRKAKAELDRVRKLIPDRPYRIQFVDFTGGLAPLPAGRRGYARGAGRRRALSMKAAPAAAGGVSVSQRLVLRARVILAAPAPEAGKK